MRKNIHLATGIIIVTVMLLGCRLVSRPQKPPKPVASSELPATPIDAPLATPSVTPSVTASPSTETESLLRYAASLEFLPGEIAGLQILGDDSVWVFTSSGFGRLTDEKWLPQTMGSAQIPIGVDETGRVWVLTDGLMSFLELDTGEITFTEEGWLTDANMFAIAGRGVATNDVGQVWMSTHSDVRVFDGQQWMVYAPGDMEFSISPPDLDITADYFLEMAPRSDTPWVGRCDMPPSPKGEGGARWWDGTTWRGAESPVAEGGCVMVIREDSRGRVWVGLGPDLWQYDPASDEWQHFDPPEPPDGYRWGSIIDIAIDSNDEPWPLFAICGGASCSIADVRYRLREGEWTQIGEPIDTLQFLVFDGAGTPWLFSGGRIYRYVDDQWIEVPDLMIDAAAVAVDADGQVWVAGTGPDTVSGIWVIEPTERPDG